MQVEAGTVRRGAVLEIEGQLFLVVKTEFRNPGNWRAILNITLKNLKTGTTNEQRWRPQDKVEVAFVEERGAEYLYSDNHSHVFMYMDDYDQISLQKDALGDEVLYLLPNTPVKIKVYDKKPVSIELPNTVRHEIKQTEPTVKRATAQAQYKPAITETGLKVMVPPFINIGDKVEIDTRSGEYLSRV